MVLRTMYVLPIKFSWRFAGDGVNLAMWDVILFGRPLVGALKDGLGKMV